jgi:hypothetical protein
MIRNLLNTSRSFIGILFMLLAWNGLGQTTYEFTTLNAVQTYPVPVGVTCVRIQAWGGGGAGGGSLTNNNEGGGGAGGCYIDVIVSVNSGENLSIVVGQGGQGIAGNGPQGQSSTISGTFGTQTATGGFGGTQGNGTDGTPGTNCNPATGFSGAAGQSGGGAGGVYGNNRDGAPGIAPGGGGAGGEFNGASVRGGHGGNGRVTITPFGPTISLTSAIGTNAQTRCLNTAITNITYATGGTATGATVTGLPAGVTGSWAANVFTITGTPTVAGTFNYTVTTTGGSCGTISANGTITVIAPTNVSTNSGNQVLQACVTSTSITGFANGLPSNVVGSTWTVSPAVGATIVSPNNTATTTVNFTTAGTYTFTYTLPNSAPCTASTSTLTVTVSSGANAGPDASVTCTGDAQLNANAPGIGQTGTWTLISFTVGDPGNPAPAPTISNVNSPTSAVELGANQCATFRWTLTGGTCLTPAFDEVTLCRRACNDDPCGAFQLSAFTSCANTLMDNYGASLTSTIIAPAPTCGAPQPGAIRDVWYQVTMPPNGNLTFTVTTGTLLDPAMAVYVGSSCSGPLTQLACNDDAIGLAPQITLNRPDLAGQTIYIRFWDYVCVACVPRSSPNEVGNFQLCITTTETPPCTPSNSDCVTATPLCASSPVGGLSDGQGCYPDLTTTATSNDGCLNGEHNTAFYLIQFQSGTTWGFTGTFSVANQGVEYDWALWEVSGDVRTGTPGDICANKGTPIRCSAARQTGRSEVGIGMVDEYSGVNPITGVDDNVTSNSTTEYSEGTSPSGDGYVYWLNTDLNGPGDPMAQDYVDLTGRYFLLVIDRGSSSTEPYGLEFFGDAVMSCDIVFLPIELVDFYGERIDRIHQLYWSTASEINNDYFTIEKSSDAKTWQVMTTVDAVGNATYLNNYSTIDHDPTPGLNYYRLTQTDFDGTSKTYKTIAISTEIEIIDHFSNLYPNPTSEYFHFNYGGKDFSSPIILSMYDATGKLVKQMEFDSFNNSQNMQVETSDIEVGMYQVIITQNEHQERKKISIIR